MVDHHLRNRTQLYYIILSCNFLFNTMLILLLFECTRNNSQTDEYYLLACLLLQEEYVHLISKLKHVLNDCVRPG